jgi:type I protein arginine methyltransferase
MQNIVARPLRAILSQTKAALTATQFGRNLLSDLNNRQEFTSLLAHERMLADRVRVDTYHEAISRHVKPGSAVIDLGTGTGILALFASKQDPRIVYALDHSEFIGVARAIGSQNGVTNIDYISSNSRDFTPNEKVDLVIHEQIGDELFTENMLENLLDLKRRVLKPEGKILPARFELYVEPAQLNEGRRIPYIWEQAIHGFDFSFLRNSQVAAAYTPSDYHCYLLDPEAVDYWLCQPKPAIYVDLNTISEVKEMSHEALMQRTVTRAGHFDGLVVWFRVIFDDDLSFDTSPLSTLTHWRCRIFRVPRREVQAGEPISYHFQMGNPNQFNTWSVKHI